MSDPYELALQHAQERHDAELHDEPDDTSDPWTTAGAQALEPDDEPMSLPDLRDLIRETAEALDTLCDALVATRHTEDDEHTRGELAALEDKLRQAWVQTMRAFVDASELVQR